MSALTGPKSTSFQVWAAGALPGLATLAHGLFTGGSLSQRISQIVAGSGLTGVSSAFKLLHDSGVHQATISQAGSDIAKDIPELKFNIDKVLGFAEADFPGLQGGLSSLEARITAQEQKVVTAVPDAAAVEAVVRRVLAGLTTPAA